MSWSDIFYPGNPGRRDKVVALFSKLLTLMENNFKATNDLIKVLHDHVPGRHFDDIEVNRDGTIKENCDIITERIGEIQAYLKEKKKELKGSIEPELYKQLTNTDVKFVDKIQLARNITKATLSTIGTIAGIAVITLIAKGRILVSLAARIGTLAASALGGLVIGVLILGIDMIISAILGSIERDRLEETIEELEAAIEKFEPASYEYSKQIMRIQIQLEG